MTNLLRKLSQKINYRSGIIGFLVLLFLGIVFNDNQEQTFETEVKPETQSIVATREEVVVPSSDGEEVARREALEFECLSLNVYHESRSDNLAGRVSVADVVLNRVDSVLYPNTICEVVQQAQMRTNWKGNVVPVRNMCQFSWWCDGLSDEPLEEDAWEDAQVISEMVLRGGWRGISEGATHYHATYVSPNWVNDRGMVPVGRIGQHKFYRWH